MGTSGQNEIHGAAMKQEWKLASVDFGLKVTRLLLTLSLCSLCEVQLHSQPVPDFTVKPDESILLLDRHTVAGTTNLSQKFFPVKKHPANPVLRRSQSWEGVGPYLFGSRLM